MARAARDAPGAVVRTWSGPDAGEASRRGFGPPRAVRVALLGILAVWPIAPSLHAQSFELAFSTYAGGSDRDSVRDVATDAAGNVYITGGTASADFITTPGAHDRTFNGVHDAYVVKLDPGGNLLWSTYLGGPNYDRAYALEVDAQGAVYVAGRAGEGFPTTPGVVQAAFAGDSNPVPRYGRQDGFVAKIARDGSRLVWSTYFGDPSNGILRDVAVDAGGSVYLPLSAEVPVPGYVTAGAWQRVHRGGYEGIVVKLSPDATRVLWGSYYGGRGDDLMTASIRADAAGAVFVAGWTNSPDLPTTTGAFQRIPGGLSDMHVAKFLPDGSGVVFSTYLGGSGGDFTETHCLAVTAAGNAVVAATTTSTDFPTTSGAFQRFFAGRGGAGTGQGTNYPGDAFVSILAADGRGLVASSYFGGRFGEGAEGIALDPDGNVHLSGATFSDDLPLAGGAYQPAPRGEADFFVARLSGDLRSLLYATYAGGRRTDYGRTLALDPGGAVLVAGETDSTDWPTQGGFDRGSGSSWEGALLKLSVADPGSPPAAPSGLRAVSVASNRVALSWQDNSIDEWAFAVERAPAGGVFVEIGATAADVISFADTGVEAAAEYAYRVRARNPSGASGYSNVVEVVTPPLPVTFVRGDTNGDGRFDISDAVYGLLFLFRGGPEPPCRKAADSNDDGRFDLADGVYLLSWLFRGTAQPRDPYRTCGEDPTEDSLSCSRYAFCP